MTVLPLDPTGAAEYFFAGARDAGLSHVVLSPGSRSTPLSVAVARTPGLTYSIELDERVAAFVALGLAKATGQPVALVCTSGTAAANYLPAVAEASMSNVPLMVVTADRPPEHQHWGVGQSFDQRGLYHRQVRDEITMPVGGSAGAGFSLRAGWRATATAIERHGPVHVNWAFRMPLEPIAAPIGAVTDLGPAPIPESLSHSLAASVADTIRGASRPLIIAGPGTVSPSPTAVRAAEEIAVILSGASANNIPILADVLSGLRGRNPTHVAQQPALITATPDIAAPDLIVHLGQTPTAKSLRLWWETFEAEHLLIDPRDEWQDPSHTFTQRARCSAEAVFLSLLTSASGGAPHLDDAWNFQWQQSGFMADRAVARTLDEWPTVTEAHVARSVTRALSVDDRIVASSSMPVRDIDTFADAEMSATVISNRGINGIDGVVSTALGVEMSATEGRTVVLVGDVASLHDVGGILAAARSGQQLTLVIPNNDGGGIFSFLPIHDTLESNVFTELFHTPHGTRFDFLSGYKNITYIPTLDVDAALRSSADRPGVTIIEVAVDTQDRLNLQSAVSTAVSALKGQT